MTRMRERLLALGDPETEAEDPPLLSSGSVASSVCEYLL